MALWRCDIRLEMPLAAYNALPMPRRLDIRDAVRLMPLLVDRINQELAKEGWDKDSPHDKGMTITAKWHICDPEQDV